MSIEQIEELDKKLDDFYKETGIWPPGRSMPRAMCGDEDKPAIRHRAFQSWMALRTRLEAAEKERDEYHNQYHCFLSTVMGE